MFFFFESETEKRVREDIQKNMDICLQNPKKYSQAIEVLTMHVNSSDQKCIQKIVDTIKATIKNEDLQPIRKYQAILLLSDLMKTHNKALGKYVVKKILKRLTILAQHKNGTKEEGDEDRGRDIFGDVASSQQTYSINFLNTLLTALQEWGTTWPKAPDGPYKDFHRQYNELVMNGVKFPKKRPKQVSKSPPPTRNSISPAANNAERSSKMNKKASQMQVEKPKSKPKGPVKQIKKSLNPELVRQANEFYDKVKESLAIFYDLLESSDIDVIPLLRDIVGELQKNSDQGTELLIKLQGEQNAETEDRKIQSYFTFMQKMDKDLNIVAKKPEKFETYRTKYLKLGKNCLDLMSQKNNKGSSVEKSESKLEQKSRQEPQGSKKQSYMTSKPPEKKDQPKIKNPNRYLSVTGLNVLGPNPNQFGSGGQNGSVERFGSFAGIQPTDRHRASIPVSSPRAQKQANSDKKQSKPFPSEAQVPSKQQSKEGVPIQKLNQNRVAEKPQIEIPKIQLQKAGLTVENKSEQNLHVTNNFFKQFVVEEKKSIAKNDISNPFKDNDSFGAFGKQTTVQNNENLDFFGQIDTCQQKPNIGNLNARRKVEKQTQEVDLFAAKMKSQLSDGLSAFVKNQNSQLSGNRLQNKLGQDTGSRKSLNFDNPFANGFTERQSQKKSETNSVEKYLDTNPFSSNILKNSRIIQNAEDDPNKKFETGNFGNIPENKKVESREAPNPFETSSMKSKGANPFQSINPYQSSGNPFQQDPFQKRSKQSHASKRSENPFDSESLHKNAPNPFQSSNIRASNPFETQTHNSKKSSRGIDDILELFKKPSKKQIETVQRQINLKGQMTKKVGDKPISANSEQARQSIVFTVDLNPDAEQGIRFSNFQDIPSPKVAETMFDNRANKQQQSSFSLSKFGELSNPYPPQTNLKNTEAFFSPFDFKQPNQSVYNIQRSSIDKNGKEQKIAQQPFAAFDFKPQPEVNQRRSYENEKTVKSRSQESFNFQRLQKISVHKKDIDVENVKSSLGFDDFMPFGQKMLEQRKSEKAAEIENKPPIEVSWGEFESLARANQEFFHNGKQQEGNSSASKLLQVDSRIGSKKDLGSASNLQKSYQSNSNSGPIKLTRQPTVTPKLQDPIPLFKKGTDWNPLSMIPNLKPPSFVYMIDDKKMKAKKQQLEQVKKQYEEKLQVFKFAKQKNDDIRKRLMERTSKVEEIISQKGEYIQILKKVKQENEIKEQQIIGINHRIKKVEDIKARILEREKKLFDITKSQINNEDRRVPVQRTTSNKWEMFNKSLEMHRNNSYSMTSRFTPQGVSYY